MQFPKQAKALWWRITKYLLIGLATFFLVFLATIWIVFEKKNDWLLQEIQSYVNESQSGQLEIKSMELSLIQSFPGVTIVLNDIQFYQHPDSLRTIDEKPILEADHFFVRLKLIPLLNEEVEISDVTLFGALLQLETNKAGELNLVKALKPPINQKPLPKIIPPTTQPKKNIPPPKKQQSKSVAAEPGKRKVHIDLEHLEIQHVVIKFNTFNASDSSIIQIDQLRANLQNEDSTINASIYLDQNIKQLHVNGITVKPGHLSLEANFSYHRTHQFLDIKSNLHLEEFEAFVEGSYAHQKNGYLNISLDASANDLQLLSLVLNPEIVKRNRDELKKGDIYLKGSVIGEIKNQLPEIDFSFGARNLSWQSVNKHVLFKNIGFDGRFRSGNAPDFSQTEIELKNLKGELPGGLLSGFFSLKNLEEPEIKYDLTADAKLDAYDEIFNFKNIKNVTGEVSVRAKYEGPLNLIATHQMDSSRSSIIAFNNISFLVLKTNKQVSGLSLNMKTNYNQSIIQPLAFQYGENKINATATVDNLLYFLIKRSGLSASGNITAPQLFTKDFLFDTVSTAAVQDRITNLSLDFGLQTTSTVDSSKNISTNMTFNIKKLSAQLEKLPDLTMVTATGNFTKVNQVFKLTLNEFHATMPYGKMDISGELLIPKRRLWEFNARVKANQFPWTYIKELVAEIRTDQEPIAKNLPVKEMDILTADLDLSASITTYPFDFNKLEIRNSRVNFSFPGSKILAAEKLNIALENLRFIHPANSGAITGLKSTKGTVQLKQLSLPGLNKLDLNMEVAGENDTLDIAFNSASQKALHEKGNFFMDISKKEIQYQLQYNVEDADLESFIRKFYKKKFMSGLIDYKLDLKTTGSSMEQAKQNLSGTVEITGDSLHLTGVDIDNVLKKFERSQNFNLTDVGAVILAGPVGLAVTKGSDFVSLAAINLNANHHTEIKELMARWKLENLQLSTEDVAFSTFQNRIAFDGKIDFARDSIPGLTIAVVDKNGCSLMDQKLYGKTTALKTGKLNITKTLFGSVINFVNVIVGKDCKPVYDGKVQAPL